MQVLNIGPYTIKPALILAPMAGVTDRPFRELCLAHGAGMVVSEMMSSNPTLWQSQKSQSRMVDISENGIRSVQIVGADPQEMADAACFCVENGAQIIDINLGCPAKKVNKRLSGSALMQYPQKIDQILKAVIDAVEVPVTVKMRTGWDTDNKNCLTVSHIAEASGVAAIAIHGRTRACMYKGDAEYQSIRQVKDNISIPVIANGDIDSPQKAKNVLEVTGADGLMIGRGAQGNPWLFGSIVHYFTTGESYTAPNFETRKQTLLQHVHSLHQFYGEHAGVRIARKHVGWYLKSYDTEGGFRRFFNQVASAQQQVDLLMAYEANSSYTGLI